MEKDICILNIFVFVSLFSSCFLTPPKYSKSINIQTEVFYSKSIEEDIKEYSKKNSEESNQNIFFNEKSGLSEIKEGEVFELLVGGYVTWAKSGNLIVIKDKYNNLIKDLEELKYSYIFSPIRFKTSLWFSYSDTYSVNNDNYKIFGHEIPIAKIIAFESTEEFEKKYEVKSLKLSSEGSNVDFEKYRIGFAKINLKETSKEVGYSNSYNFGVFDDSLTDSFQDFYKKSKCNYMLAYLTIRNKQTGEYKTYEIVLNLKLFNDTVKLIFDKYSNLSRKKLKLFIDK
ncbi:S2/P23 family protein [Borreliella bavariensis]|uniref:S2/P23 family protein n=1 Tax=Borreliella bavariensis TaxID=664662 RepID=UPI001C0052A7|nr:S2/P23 family protein [Borreliella bavariensis]